MLLAVCAVILWQDFEEVVGMMNYTIGQYGSY